MVRGVEEDVDVDVDVDVAAVLFHVVSFIGLCIGLGLCCVEAWFAVVRRLIVNIESDVPVAASGRGGAVETKTTRR